MNEHSRGTHPGRPRALKRRELLRAAAAAGGAMIAMDHATAGAALQSSQASDPQLRAALLKYGGEFGQLGKGGSDGDL